MIPTADYDAHPAFAPFCHRSPSSDAFVGMNLVSDEIIDEFVMTGGRHKDLIERNIRKYEETLVGDTKIDQRLHHALRTAIRGAHNALVDDKQARATIRGIEPTSRAVRTNVDSLYDHGYFASELPSDMLRQIQSSLAPDIETLRSRSFIGNGAIIQMFPSDPTVYQIVEEFCRRYGVFDSLSSYFGKRYGRLGFVIHYSSPRDSWYRVFDDVGLPIAKTTQMHFDSSYVHPKAMLYLNDVGSANGAFSVIPRRLPFDNLEFDLAYGKEMLSQLYGVAKAEFGWSVKDNESGFRCPQLRELFVSLPHSLRRTSHVGDHLLDGSLVSEDLLAREVFIEGDAGCMPVFAGSHTLHRGGIVTTDERIALQIIFYPPLEEEIVAQPTVAAEPVEAPAAGTPKASLKKPLPQRLRDAIQVLVGHS